MGGMGGGGGGGGVGSNSIGLPGMWLVGRDGNSLKERY